MHRDPYRLDDAAKPVVPAENQETIIWPRKEGETMTAWRADVAVTEMSPLKKMPKQAPSCVRTGASEHGGGPRGVRNLGPKGS